MRVSVGPHPNGNGDCIPLSGRARYLPLLLIVIVGFGLRMWDVGSRALWFDEAVEYWTACSPLRALSDNVRLSFQPPLYTFILHMWLKLGMTPLWLRSLSVGLSMVSIVGIMKWGRKLLGLRGALLAGVLMALSPSDIRYAQEVGEYALMVCMLTWMLYILDITLENPRWGIWGLWGGLATASVYTHYGSGIVIIALAFILLARNLWYREIKSFLRQIVILLVIFPLWALLLIYFLPQQIGNIPRKVLPVGSLGAEFRVFTRSVVDSFFFVLTGWPYTRIPKWGGEVVLLIAGAIAVRMLIKPREGVPIRLLGWLLGSYLLYFAMVRLGLYGYGNYGFRHALVMSPLFILSMATVLEWLIRANRRWIATGLLIVVIVMELASLPNRTWSQYVRGNMAWPETEDMDKIVSYWLGHHRNGEATYVYYGAAPAFRYYLHLYGFESISPPPGWYALCWKGAYRDACAVGDVYYGQGLRKYSPEEKIRSVWNTLGGEPDRVWMIFSHGYQGEESIILKWLNNYGYMIVLSKREVNASVYLLVRDSGRRKPSYFLGRWR